MQHTQSAADEPAPQGELPTVEKVEQEQAGTLAGILHGERQGGVASLVVLHHTLCQGLRRPLIVLEASGRQMFTRWLQRPELRSDRGRDS